MAGSGDDRRRDGVDFLRGKVPEGAGADRLVERALFLAATGYCYTEERREITEKGEERTEKITRASPPLPCG